MVGAVLFLARRRDESDKIKVPIWCLYTNVCAVQSRTSYAIFLSSVRIVVVNVTYAAKMTTSRMSPLLAQFVRLLP
jgi:hypothetical protein